MRRATLLRLLGLLVLLSAIIAAFIYLPVRDFLDWVKDLGPWGPVLLGAFYIPACLLLLPGSPITLAGGAMFGLVEGTIAISIGSTLGASAAFLAGRFLARGWIEKKVAGDPRFRAVDQAISTQGFKIVLLLRLSPVFPFNILNYALGLTRVSFRDYFFASWIGMFPGTVMYVYLGSVVKNLDDLFSRNYDGGAGPQVLFWFGLVATVVVTVYVTRLARRALQQAIAKSEQPPAETDHA